MDKFLQLPDDMNAICDIYRDEICYYYYILQIYRNKPIVKNEDIQHLENPLGKSVKKVLDIVKGGGDLSSLIEPTLDRWGNYYSNISEFYFLLEEYGIRGNTDFVMQVMDLEPNHMLKKAIDFFCSYRVYTHEEEEELYRITYNGKLKILKYDIVYYLFLLEENAFYENIPTYEYFCNNFTGDIFNRLVANIENRFISMVNDEDSSDLEIGYDDFTKIAKISEIPPDDVWLRAHFGSSSTDVRFKCEYKEVVKYGEKPFDYKHVYQTTSAKLTDKSKEDLRFLLKKIGAPYNKTYYDYVSFLYNTSMIKGTDLKKVFGSSDSFINLCHLYRIYQIFVPSPIKPKQFLNHTHIVGRSGSGKSELLKTIIKQVGESCILIDPHGDIADSLDKKQNFFKIAPTESRFVINPFDIDDKSIDNRELVAEEIIQLLQEIIQDSNVSVLMKTVSFPIISTLLKLSYADFKMLADCINPISGIEHLEQLTPFVDDHLKHIWKDLKTDTYDTTKRSIFNRLQSFLNKHKIISTVCGYDDFGTTIKRVEQGENLVISLPIPQMGEDVSEVLGRFFMCRMQIWAKRRQSLAEKDRKPVLLIIDECQNFLSEETARTLDQFGRKFGLYMVLAHQHINQIDGKGLKGSILANCKNKIVGYCDESTAKPMGSAIGVSYDEFTKLKKGHFWSLFEDQKPLKFYARLAKFKTIGETINYAQSQNTEFVDGWELVQMDMKKTTQNTAKTPKFTAKFDL